MHFCPVGACKSEGQFEEEYWSKAIGNNMVGTLRVIKSGDSIFYEFWAIEVEDGKVIFKMKHFNHGLLGWEEKNDVIRLVMTVKGEQNIVFTNSDNSLSLRYERKGDELTGELKRVKAGKIEEDTFHFRRSE